MTPTGCHAASWSKKVRPRQGSFAGAAAGIAQGVEAVETGGEADVARGDRFGRGGLEIDPPGEAVRSGVGVRLFDGRGVEVVAHEGAVRESLGHQQGEEADAAGDVG